MAGTMMTGLAIKTGLAVLAYLCYRELYELFNTENLQHALYARYGLGPLYWIIKPLTVALALLVLKYVWSRDPRGIRYAAIFLALGIALFGLEVLLLNRDPAFAFEAYLQSRASRGLPADRERTEQALRAMSSWMGLIAVLLFGLPLLGLWLKKREMAKVEAGP
jgi:hypothetical protein